MTTNTGGDERISEYGYRIYEAIIGATSSELILFFVILAVVAIPLYIVVLRGRRADRQHEREEKSVFIEVIKENTQIMAGVKVLLENSGDATKSALERIHGRIDEQGNTLLSVSNDVAQINAKFTTSLSNQKEMASKLNKVLLIVNAIPNNSPIFQQNEKEGDNSP